MPQFLIRKSPQGGAAFVEDEEAHHAQNVFRLKEGDAIRLFDGKGGGYSGTIRSLKKEMVEVAVTKEFRAQPPAVRVTLAQSVLPRDAMDWAVHKAVELGASAIAPVVAERCVSRADKKDHWEKVVLAACKQCDRLDLPQVLDALPLLKISPRIRAYAVSLYASLEKSAKPLREALNQAPPESVLALTGPEGDFSPAEFEFLRAEMTGVSFGTQVLKSETASIFMLSVLKYQFSL